MYNGMEGQHGCHTVKFYSRNNLLSSIHTVLVYVPCSVCL